VLAQAERLGQLLAEARFSLICGGYGGTMEAVCRGASTLRQSDVQRIGVTMDLFTPPLEPNRWLTDEERVGDFYPRLVRLTSADAFIVLLGGIGTLTEATLAWSLLQTGQISPRPFVFVGSSWRRLFSALQAETLMTQREFALATVVDTVDQAIVAIHKGLAPAL
jgi:uncharacterized protein (TIGR00725 family)